MLKICSIFAIVFALTIVQCESYTIGVGDNLVYKTVQSRNGAIRGKLNHTLINQKPYFEFLGVPYAQKPVGNLRFKAPEPVESWSDTYDAFEYKNGCMQLPTSEFSRSISEDCLYLNVFVPVVNGTERLAVMFYIHGGYFIMKDGDDAIYGPDFLIERDIILVTINYRLAALGFLSLGMSEYSGNMGLKDQQLAMKWIYENIERFDGDNNRITISGYSAGSKSVGHHVLDENSSKYFQQLHSMSGAANHYFSYQDGDHRCIVDQFAKKHSKNIKNDEDLVEFLQSAPIDLIMNLTKENIYPSFDTIWNPTIEKKDAIRPIILVSPAEKIKRTNFNKTSFITFNKYEALVRVPTEYGNPEKMDAFLNDFWIILPIHGYYSDLSRKPYLKNLMAEIREFYFGNTTNDTERIFQRVTLDSDLQYIFSIHNWVKNQLKNSHKDIFYHRFSVDSLLNKPKNVLSGAGHTDQICYIFRCQKFNAKYEEILQTKDSDKDSAVTFNVMENMTKLISNFVKYGKPAIDGDPVKDSNPLRIGAINFLDVTNDGLIVGKSPNSERMAFLEKVEKEGRRLVEEHGDSPKETKIQRQCRLQRSKED